MAKLIVSGIASDEIDLFGGKVLVEIDNKSIGYAANAQDLVVDVSPGRHVLMMCHLHKSGAYVGNVEKTIDLGETDQILMKYYPPALVGHPGTIVTSEFDGSDFEARQKSGQYREITEAKEHRQNKLAKESARDKKEAWLWGWFALLFTVATFVTVCAAPI